MSINKIRNNYTTDELTDSFVLTSNVKQSKSVLSKSLKDARKRTQSEINDQARLTLKLMQLKFQIEDYLKSDSFNPKFTFSYFLKEYVDVLKKKRKVFAQEISIDETELSQLINKHRQPNDSIIIRLEIHSNNSIPAVSWYKLLEMEKVHSINNNVALRKKETKNVKNRVELNLV
jgi:plasmid maintenance system antidote protein VapI